MRTNVSRDTPKPGAVEPVAWMYSNGDASFVQFNRANMDPRYWTETPLYTASVR